MSFTYYFWCKRRKICKNKIWFKNVYKYYIKIIRHKINNILRIYLYFGKNVYRKICLSSRIFYIVYIFFFLMKLLSCFSCITIIYLIYRKKHRCHSRNHATYIRTRNIKTKMTSPREKRRKCANIICNNAIFYDIINIIE